MLQKLEKFTSVRKARPVFLLAKNLKQKSYPYNQC